MSATKRLAAQFSGQNPGRTVPANTPAPAPAPAPAAPAPAPAKALNAPAPAPAPSAVRPAH
eukprot:5198622-Pleurochrysis_carterae.AAC.1